MKSSAMVIRFSDTPTCQLTYLVRATIIILDGKNAGKQNITPNHRL